MKSGVRIINCARGGIVDENDLAAAIKEGKVAGAALDVYVDEPPAADHPLLKLDQVITTPHLGASTDEAQLNVAIAVAEQMVDFLSQGVLRYAVNAPIVARDRGIKVVESKSSRASDFANYITVKADTGKIEMEVEGVVFGAKHPRIVRVDNFYLEAVPEGYILILRNRDVPGVVGTVGTLLSKKALQELRDRPEIVSAVQVKL